MGNTKNQKNVEAIYPLSPVQHAFLIQSLLPGQSDLGFLQNNMRIRGDLQVPLFKQAWQQVMQRHAALRTSVHWEDLEKPLQVVHKQVELSWEEQDWQNLPETEQEKRFTDYLKEDRARGFSLSRAPIMRLALMRVSPDVYQFIWSCHHLLLDGWSEAIVFNEMLDSYSALVNGQSIEWQTPRPYRDYVVWLQQQDLSDAEAYWKEAIPDFSGPTRLGLSGSAERAVDKDRLYKDRQFVLSEEETQSLQDFARQRHLTLNTIILGAWALLLSRYTGREDVIFGTTFSGRPANLQGMESMVGLFINTLPLCVQVPPTESLVSWFHALQSRQAEMIRYTHTPLAQIQEWTGIPGNRRLFESLIAVENYPWNNHAVDSNSEIEFYDFFGVVSTSYPLAILVRRNPTLSLQMTYDSRCFTEDMIGQIGTHFQTLLVDLINGDQTISELLVGPELITDTPVSVMETDSPAPSHTDGVSSSVDILDDVNLPDPTKARMMDIWQEVLGIPHIDATDNFFDLGGHSLAVVQLFAKIEEAFGKTLPLSTLFEAPTIEQMLDLLKQRDWAPSWSALVSIQPEGHKPPFFCAHPISGHNLRYPHLAKYLGEDQPFYGLQSPAVHEEPITYRSIEDMATQYVEEIRTFQPEGPYYLGGHSYGGMIAFEMAQQLQQQGQEVALLAMLETMGPDYESEAATDHYRKALESRSIGEQVSYVAGGLVRRTKYHTGQLFRSLAFRWFKQVERPLSDDLRLARIIEYNTRALEEYTPQVYPGKVTLLRGEVRDGDRELGWNGWAADGLEVHIVPGHHDNFLYEPGVVDVAAILRSCLEKVQPQIGQFSK